MLIREWEGWEWGVRNMYSVENENENENEDGNGNENGNGVKSQESRVEEQW